MLCLAQSTDQNEIDQTGGSPLSIIHEKSKEISLDPAYPKEEKKLPSQQAAGFSGKNSFCVLICHVIH